jgi:hypothetical protein
MKTKQLITLNAILAIGFGIACALYGPLVMAFFGIPEVLDSGALAYWHVAAFVRMFGAALFGFGLLLWALRSALNSLSPQMVRGVLSALLLSNLVGMVAAVTQVTSVWSSVAGWIMTGVFGIFTLTYGYFWIRQ